MHSTGATPPPQTELARTLGAGGEAEYCALVRVVTASRGRFALLPIESDYRPTLRDALLERLDHDLSAAGIKLRIVRLSSDRWDPRQWAATEKTSGDGQAMVVVGLEETPGIVPESGKPPRRPPALALLNICREALRRRLPGPLLLWCEPFTYVALQEHAPDLFDFYLGLFTFLDAGPRTESPRW